MNSLYFFKRSDNFPVSYWIFSFQISMGKVMNSLYFFKRSDNFPVSKYSWASSFRCSTKRVPLCSPKYSSLGASSIEKELPCDVHFQDFRSASASWKLREYTSTFWATKKQE